MEAEAAPRRPVTGDGDRPFLADLFCGAGGMSMGYHRAGFRVVGFDIKPQPNYPFEFHQMNALDVDLTPFAAASGSPPCQDNSRLLNATRRSHGTGWLLSATRDKLKASGLPWVIENVPGAPMRTDLRLCGCQFGLPGLRRARWFETSWHAFELRPPCHHIGETVTVAGHGAQGREYRAGVRHTQEDRRRAMGIDWMNRDELAQAVPPVFAEFVGRLMLEHMRQTA